MWLPPTHFQSQRERKKGETPKKDKGQVAWQGGLTGHDLSREQALVTLASQIIFLGETPPLQTCVMHVLVLVLYLYNVLNFQANSGGLARSRLTYSIC